VTVVAQRRLTADEFMAMRDARDYELIDGHLVERKLMGAYADHIAARITSALIVFNNQQPVGRVSRATVGNMALGLVVTDLDGRAITFARATGRYFGKWISESIFGIGYVMAAFTEKKQALHDLIANTLVVRRSLPQHTSGIR